MILKLSLSHFRNLSKLSFEPTPSTLITGQNGSGKTSILESLFVLSHKRSFRTSLLDHAIQTGMPYFYLESSWTLCKQEQHKQNQNEQIKLQKVKDKLTEIQSNYPFEPFFLISPHLDPLVIASSEEKRRIFDWSLEYLYDNYAQEQKNYKKLLDNRNKLLKNKNRNYDDFWLFKLSQSGESLHYLRFQFFTGLAEKFIELLQDTAFSGQIRLVYAKGWQGNSLYDALKASKDRDYARSTTLLGAHTYKLHFLHKERPISEFYSRGQLKLINLYFSLALCQIIAARYGSLVFALDDITAELDKKYRHFALQSIKKSNFQVFVTSIEEDTHIAKSMDSVLRL